jgi:hypothetical protein
MNVEIGTEAAQFPDKCNFPCSAEAEFKEKHGETWQLTITAPYIIVVSEVQLSIPTTTNADECFLL